MKAGRRRFRLRKVLLIGFLSYMGLLLLWQEVVSFRLGRELAAVTEQVRAAHEDNAKLYAQLRDMKSDAYIEKMAREHLGLTRSGEVPFLPIPADQ